VVRTELTTATAEERCILRMRFSEGLSIADIARRLDIDQKTLYRTVPRILQRLRGALEHSGLGAHEVLSALTRNEVNLRNVYVTSNLVAMPTPALRSLSPSR
jgi:transposase-like protein